MKPFCLHSLRPLCLSLTLVCLAASTAVAQFEGTLDMKLSSAKANGMMKISISKSGSSRNEVEMKSPEVPAPIKMTMLVKAATPNVVYMINDKKKSYSEIDTKEAASRVQNTETYTVKKLGTEKLMGYSCEHVQLTGSNGTTSEMWNTREFLNYDTFRKMQQNMGDDNLNKALKDANADGMPLKVVQQSGDEKVTMEVTKVDKKSLSAALFEVPSGYTKTDIMGTMDVEQYMSPEQKKQMDDAMKNMTPEQRQMMKDMMKGKGK